MNAVRYHRPGDIRVEKVDIPTPKTGQIQIKIAWNGICGTDLHAYLAEIPIFPTATTPNSVTGECLPITLGHEFSGTISAVGDDVDKSEWRIGQNVVVDPIISCMKDDCEACASGSRAVCPNVTCIGIGGNGGGLAEYIVVDAKYAFKLPEGISLEVGACVEPLAVAWHAVKQSKFTTNDSALILGSGPIGFLILKVLRSISPESLVMVSEPTLMRRSLALKHGATLVIDPSSCDGAKQALETTHGRGFDVVFEVAGVQSAIDLAVSSVKTRGVVVNVASVTTKLGVDINAVVKKEISLIGTCCYDNEHREVLDALSSGKISGIEDIITSKISAQEIIEKGIKALLDETDTQLKILVHPLVDG